MGGGKMTYPKAYIQYLVCFHGSRDYFECHEVLEEHWKKESKEKRKKYWVGLIQIAVALYHHRRGNFNGAIKLMKNAIRILQEEKSAIEALSLNHKELLALLIQRYSDLLNREQYTSIHLPIVSKKLIELCKDECERQNYKWGSVSDMNNDFVLHKHKLRDRSKIIAERESKIKKRS